MGSGRPFFPNHPRSLSGAQSQASHVIKSPRLSPLQNFDLYLQGKESFVFNNDFLDFLKKVNSDFPYSKRRSSQHNHS